MNGRALGAQRLEAQRCVRARGRIPGLAGQGAMMIFPAGLSLETPLKGAEAKAA